MSGEPKTLTLTLKEALAEARERNWKVTFGPSFTVKIHDETGFELAFGWGWEGPFAAALGVRVVARDEAAEPKSIGWDDVTEEHVVGAFLDAQAEAHRYRNALEALLNSSHRGIYDAAWALEAVANAEALISPGLDDDYRKAKAREAYERRLAGGENER